MREQCKVLADQEPGPVARIRRIRHGQVVDLICGGENDFSEVGIIEGSEAEPGHEKRPNPGDWAQVLPRVVIGDRLEPAPLCRSSPADGRSVAIPPVR